MNTDDTPLREQKRRQSRNAILDACADELARRAEDEIPVEEIAARAEVSRATVFNYFATKRDIIVGIAEREIDALFRLAGQRQAFRLAGQRQAFKLAGQRQAFRLAGQRQAFRLAGERQASGAPPLETISELMYTLVGDSFSEPVVAWRVLRTLFDDPSREDLPVRRLLRLIEELVAAAQSAGDLRAELNAGACARAIVGTYFAELFVIAGGSARSEHVDRSDFDAVAGQLIAPWTPSPRPEGTRG